MLYNVLIKFRVFHSISCSELRLGSTLYFNLRQEQKAVNAVNMVAYKPHSLMFLIFLNCLHPCFEVISKGIWLLAHYIKQLLPLAEALHHAKVK